MALGSIRMDTSGNSRYSRDLLPAKVSTKEIPLADRQSPVLQYFISEYEPPRQQTLEILLGMKRVDKTCERKKERCVYLGRPQTRPYVTGFHRTNTFRDAKT